RLVARMHLEDLRAAFDVRTIDDDLPVETARTQQRRVQYVRTVRGSDENNAGILIEAVHFDEQLVERLLALVVAAAQACAALAAHGINFIDEDDARCGFFRLVEQVSHARCAHADKHFNEVRTGDGEKRHAGFARDRASEKRLAGARRSEKQHALWNARSERLEFLWI